MGSRANRRWRALGREAETRMMGVKGRSSGAGTWSIQMRLFWDIHKGRSGFLKHFANPATSASTWKQPIS